MGTGPAAAAMVGMETAAAMGVAEMAAAVTMPVHLNTRARPGERYRLSYVQTAGVTPNYSGGRKRHGEEVKFPLPTEPDPAREA